MPAAQVIGGVIGIAKTVAGLVNKGKAKREAKELAATRPKYSIDEGFQQNLDLAESELSTGLSANAENAYNQLNDKQFSSSLDAILKSGGTASNVADVYGQGQEGRLRLAQLSDQMRLSKINSLMRSRESLAGERDKEWQINEFAPWQDKARANAEARRGADEQIWSGLQTVGSSAMQFFDQRDQKKQYQDYLKTKETNNQVAPTSYTLPSRGNVVLPTSSPNTGMLPKYQSHWDAQQEGDTLSSILNMAY